MKKNIITAIIISLSIMMLVSLIVFSCNKNKTPIIKQDNSNVPVEINPSKDIVIGFYFSWAWHRAKHECKRGFGICNFKLERISIALSEQPNSTPILIDSSGNYYVVVLIDKNTPPFDDEKKSLYIDEDLFSFDPDNNLFKISKGTYAINDSLGDLGGYIIPLEIVKD